MATPIVTTYYVGTVKSVELVLSAHPRYPAKKKIVITPSDGGPDLTFDEDEHSSYTVGSSVSYVCTTGPLGPQYVLN